eukprot:968952-Rhodomonas_salina.2
METTSCIMLADCRCTSATTSGVSFRGGRKHARMTTQPRRVTAMLIASLPETEVSLNRRLHASTSSPMHVLYPPMRGISFVSVP